MKRYLASLSREMEIKTIMKYCLTSVRIAIIKKSTNNKCWRGCGEKRTLPHCWWECKLVQPLWETVWKFIKKLKTELPYDTTIPFLGIYLEEKHGLKGYVHPSVHCSTVYNRQDMEATYMFTGGGVEKEDVIHIYNGLLLQLLLSRFSHVRLYATPETAAHQAPPSLGFSRQEHWSGLPFPSPMEY